MTREQQLKLQAFLDGELAEPEAREVAGWLARDPEAAALLAELRHTRQALAGFEAGTKLPESREFYWSKIKRDILRAEPGETAVAPPVPLFAILRRALIPATALAALVVAVMIVLDRTPATADLETTGGDASALTYRDYESGTTLVWLSYPAENGLADNPGTAIIQ